jgi:hypothetical protein
MTQLPSRKANPLPVSPNPHPLASKIPACPAWICAVDLSDVAAALHRTFGAEGPKANYSGLGAMKDTFVRDGSQLEQASPEAHEAFVRAASSKSQAAVLLRSAVPRIEKSLGGLPWAQFRKTQIESRLRGIRGHWEDWAAHARTLTVPQLHKGLQNGLMDVLTNVVGDGNIPRDNLGTAQGSLAPKKPTQAGGSGVHPAHDGQALIRQSGTHYFSSSSMLRASSTRTPRTSSSAADWLLSRCSAQPGIPPKRFSISRRNIFNSPLNSPS